MDFQCIKLDFKQLNSIAEQIYRLKSFKIQTQTDLIEYFIELNLFKCQIKLA